MFGALLAYFLHRDEAQFLRFFSDKRIRTFISVGLIIVYASLLIFHTESTYVWVFFRSIFGVLCAGFIALLVVGFKGGIGLMIEYKYLVYGGKLSYAVYLLHNFVPGMLIEIKKLEFPIFIEFMIYFIATILMSMLLHKFVESPIRKWSKGFKIINN